jgi:hypothetical protein
LKRIWEQINQWNYNENLAQKGKKIACFFLFRDLKTFWPMYCRSMKMKAADKNWEITVAMAAPRISNPNTKMNLWL